MALQINMGSMMQCSFGAAPASLIVVVPTVIAEGTPAANIMDHIPMVNIPTFGMCSSLANPTVAAATAAALGVLTPMPCVPATSAPWVPGAVTVPLRKAPALDQTSTCMCNWAGVITFTKPGTTKTMVP
jgi:Domain of unknown function (DUF4280)